jgi:hypothetical protein
MRSLSRLFAGMAVIGMAAFGMAAFGMAGCEGVEKAAPPEADAQPHTQQPQAQQQSRTLHDTTGWRARMQQNHDAAQSIEQQVTRLTKDLELTPAQQTKARALAWEHNKKIQAILDTAPPTLTREDFTVQVHAISKEFHDSVNAILTPHQLELMKNMVGRLDSGQERRRAP